MRYTIAIGVVTCLVGLLGASAQAATYTIPPEKVDTQKVYLGAATGFEKAAKVDYERVIKSTPEYSEVKKKKIEPGTGKYWILLSQASDRAVRAISEVGQASGYDFIAAQAYLGGLEPSIPSEDITSLVVDKLTTGAQPAPKKEIKEKAKTKDAAKDKTNSKDHEQEKAESTSSDVK